MMVAARRAFVRGSAVRIAVLMLGAALLLAGCGRKGQLEPPPSAQLAGPGGTAEKQPAVMDRHGEPTAPPGPKRHIILDYLID
jgi:predicted small lipoprotein YifL